MKASLDACMLSITQFFLRALYPKFFSKVRWMLLSSFILIRIPTQLTISVIDITMSINDELSYGEDFPNFQSE